MSFGNLKRKFSSVVDPTARHALTKLNTVLGINNSATNMGTYTGATITDNGTVKENIQALETATELRTVATVLAATDGADLVGTRTVTQLLANTDTARGAGSKWYAEDFVYLEAASAATDHHLITAGGVKLYVQEPYYYRAFGAIGNGVTDDTMAVQKAVNAGLLAESNIYGTYGDQYYITTGINVPKEHIGVLRKWISIDGKGSSFLLGTGVTLFSYDATGETGLELANYFIHFKDFAVFGTQGNGAKAFRPAGFVTCKYTRLYFQEVDYPFYYDAADTRNTQAYVQGATIHQCYSNRHKTFFCAELVYDFRATHNTIDAGVNGFVIDRAAEAQSGYVSTISENVLQSHTGHGIIAGATTAGLLNNNYMENNSFDILLTGGVNRRDGTGNIDGVYGVHWEYIAPVTAWVSNESFSTVGLYRTYLGNIYIKEDFSLAGTTPPTHTSGTVAYGSAVWTFVGTYDAWVTGATITNVGTLKSSNTKIYRAATPGTCGAAAPAHTISTAGNYGGAISNNFSQPPGSPATGYRAMIEGSEAPLSGTIVTGNADQAGNNLLFSGYSRGYAIALGTKVLPAATLYARYVRPSNVRVIFNEGSRFGAIWGNSGGVILNPSVRGIEYTHAEWDYYDATDNIRVPIVHGIAQVVPFGNGAGEGLGHPPTDFGGFFYAQKAWAKGSVLYNPTHASGGPVAWICTASGRLGTWAATGIVGGIQATEPTTTYVAPAGGATVDAEARASLAQLAVDLADLKTKLATAKTTA